MALLKHACNFPMCPEIIEGKERYCKEHKGQDDKRYNQARDIDIQKLYNSTRWKMERRRFLNAHPLCECEECIKGNSTTAATMVDHRIPHEGNLKLFWDKYNWQAMSLEHHNIKTGREKKTL